MRHATVTDNIQPSSISDLPSSPAPFYVWRYTPSSYLPPLMRTCLTLSAPPPPSVPVRLRRDSPSALSLPALGAAGRLGAELSHLLTAVRRKAAETVPETVPERTGVPGTEAGPLVTVI